MDSPCAIKENLDTSPEAQRQFEREARLLYRLRHPNLPVVHDYFMIAGQGQYLVMDFIEGEDLEQMLRRTGPLTQDQALPWIEQVCDALEYLHSRQPPVIHRDIKPANIKITPEGQAILVDFGISKLYDPNLSTTYGARAVTTGYSPPEQYGKGKTDAQSDVYALGATLYNLLSGVEPPASMDLSAGLEPPPGPVHELNPQVVPGVSMAIVGAMQLDRARRTRSVSEFKQALAQEGRLEAALQPEQHSLTPPTQVLTPLPVIPSASTPARSQPTPGRLPWLWGLIALVVIAGVVAITLNIDSLIATERIAANNTLPSLVPTKAPITSPQPTPLPTQQPQNTQASLPAIMMDDFGIPMALIPAGEFQMGREDGYVGEYPEHTVFLEDFFIDIYEVTNAHYAECVNAEVCTPPQDSRSQTRSNYYDNPAYAEHPVIYINWTQAFTFCEWRGARLPSEAEWEVAARGGLQGKLYPWGDENPTCLPGSSSGAQFISCSPADTIKVGSFGSNGFGIYDMAGNVWEWVRDWYAEDYYANSPSQNPTGPTSGALRVLRGGSWDNHDFGLYIATRSSNYPHAAENYIGFRCARSP